MAETVEALLNEELDYDAFEEDDHLASEPQTPAHASKADDSKSCEPAPSGVRSSARTTAAASAPRRSQRQSPSATPSEPHLRKPVISWSAAMGGGGGGGATAREGRPPGRNDAAAGSRRAGSKRSGSSERAISEAAAKKPKNDVASFILDRRDIDERKQGNERLTQVAKLRLAAVERIEAERARLHNRSPHAEQAAPDRLAWREGPRRTGSPPRRMHGPLPRRMVSPPRLPPPGPYNDFHVPRHGPPPLRREPSPSRERYLEQPLPERYFDSPAERGGPPLRPGLLHGVHAHQQPADQLDLEPTWRDDHVWDRSHAGREVQYTRHGPDYPGRTQRLAFKPAAFAGLCEDDAWGRRPGACPVRSPLERGPYPDPLVPRRRLVQLHSGAHAEAPVLQDPPIADGNMGYNPYGRSLSPAAAAELPAASAPQRVPPPPPPRKVAPTVMPEPLSKPVSLERPSAKDTASKRSKVPLAEAVRQARGSPAAAADAAQLPPPPPLPGPPQPDALPGQPLPPPPELQLGAALPQDITDKGSPQRSTLPPPPAEKSSQHRSLSPPVKLASRVQKRSRERSPHREHDTAPNSSKPDSSKRDSSKQADSKRANRRSSTSHGVAEASDRAAAVTPSAVPDDQRQTKAGSWLRERLRQAGSRGPSLERGRSASRDRRRSASPTIRRALLQNNHRSRETGSNRRSEPSKPRNGAKAPPERTQDSASPPRQRAGRASPSLKAPAFTAQRSPSPGAPPQSSSDAEQRRAAMQEPTPERLSEEPAAHEPAPVDAQQAAEPQSPEAQQASEPSCASPSQSPHAGPGSPSAEDEAAEEDDRETIKEWSYEDARGREYEKHSILEFRSWLLGLEQQGDKAAYEEMRNSPCWMAGTTERMRVWEAIERFGSAA